MCEMEATPTDTVYVGVYVKLENLFQPPLLLLTTPITVCFSTSLLLSGDIKHFG